MNISDDTLIKLNELYTYQLYDDHLNIVDKESATEIYIGYEKINGQIVDKEGYFYKSIGRSIKAKKSEVTLDWLIEKIDKENVFKNFSKEFNKLIKKKVFSAYPTSYEIGVFVAVGLRESIEDTKQKIEEILHTFNIKYTNEFSEAVWIFRYKISKDKETINKLKQIK